MLVSVTDEQALGERCLTYTARPAYHLDTGTFLPAGVGTDKPELHGFAVRAVRFASCDGFEHGRPCYTEAHLVRLEDAEAMTRLLRKVERGVERLNGQFGYWKDPAGLTAYVAEALGIRGERPFIRRTDPARDITGRGWRDMNRHALTEWLAAEEKQWAVKWAQAV